MGIVFGSIRLTCRILSLSLLFMLMLAAGGFAIQMVNAAVSLREICDGLNYELLTNEVYYAITKNLTLPSEINGAQIAWESNSRAVDATTGEVLRERYNDVDVMLTATVSLGAESAIKELPFVVLSQQAEVYMTEGFAYDVEDKRITNIPGVEVHEGTASSSLRGKGWAFAGGSRLSTAPTGGMDAVVSKNTLYG